MKKLALVVAVILMGGCTGRSGPMGPTGPQGVPGIGLPGPGYTEVQLSPTRDTVIGPSLGDRSEQPTIGLGYSTGTSEPIRSLLYFDMSQTGIPTSTTVTVTDASIELIPTGGSTAGNLVSIQAYQITQTWDDSATWIQSTSTTSWSNSGGTFATELIGTATVDVATTNKVTIKISAGIVQNWLNGNYNQGIVLKSATESGANAEMLFGSIENTDAAKRPKLTMRIY